MDRRKSENVNIEAAEYKVEYVNNHIHTTYSFSPYTPEEAVYKARDAGLPTAGLMDHDTVAGADEFIRAGKKAGIATTVGIEVRCSAAGTPFEGRRLNNTDQLSVAYVAIHAIPHDKLDNVQKFMAPLREARNARSREMTVRLNELFAPYGIPLDFSSDVEPISSYRRGGSITERHIIFALAKKLTERFGEGEKLLRFLDEAFGLSAAGSVREKLGAAGVPFYEYHLLGFLKGGFSDKFYIDATDELPHITDILRLSEEIGAISAYAYLGDVKNSVTGDKKDREYEDGYLDELIEWLSSAGFRALTYMPARNTEEQLERVMSLCDRHGLFQISGEDINSPFQSFVCRALENPRYARLVSAAWALVGHEKAATGNPENGMFSKKTISSMGSLDERIDYFAAIGRNT